jgi:hypothetical protein
MKSVLVCTFLFIIGSGLFVSRQERRPEDKGAAQSAGDQIEVKTDRFSGVTTLALKPQVIVDKPDHIITMEIETKLGEKKNVEWEQEQAHVRFKSQSKDVIKYGDKQLHFIVDGKHIDLGECAGGPRAFVDPAEMKPGFKILHVYTSILDIPQLTQIVGGKQVEMRLGSIELTLNQSVLAILREYANQVSAKRNTTGRKP